MRDGPLATWTTSRCDIRAAFRPHEPPGPPNPLIEANDRHHPGAVVNVRELLTGLGDRGTVLVGRRPRTLDSMGDPELLHAQALENFIFVHESRRDLFRQLELRLPSA